MRIVDNNRNNHMNADNNCMVQMQMQMQIPKSAYYILRMRILLIASFASAFSPIILTSAMPVKDRTKRIKKQDWK
jgi:hypothetical protein